MGLGVLRVQVVGVVGGEQGKVEILSDSTKPVVHGFLLGIAVVLDLQEEMAGLEVARQGLGRLLGPLETAVDEGLWDLPGEAGGGGDETGPVLLEQLVIDSGFVVESLQIRH